LIGVLLIIGGDALNLLERIGVYWPIILIAIGLYILVAPRRRQS
jgi:hypothetical protein